MKRILICPSARVGELAEALASHGTPTDAITHGTFEIDERVEWVGMDPLPSGARMHSLVTFEEADSLPAEWVHLHGDTWNYTRDLTAVLLAS